jgi:hypothetical protein
MIRIEPQPPRGIKYIVGDESWLAPEKRTPLRLICEEWGQIGPMVIDSSIKPNAAGFPVRVTEFLIPEGMAYTKVDGAYYWIPKAA